MEATNEYLSSGGVERRVDHARRASYPPSPAPSPAEAACTAGVEDPFDAERFDAPPAAPPVRYLTGHKVNPANDRITIAVTDAPGAGGAQHRYEISGFDSFDNASRVANGVDPYERSVLLFQNGPIAEAGVNGITHEVLLAILIDRLQSFQQGQFSCRENAIALTKLEEAQHWLHHRTLKRMQQGVEGIHAVHDPNAR